MKHTIGPVLVTVHTLDGHRCSPDCRFLQLRLRSDAAAAECVFYGSLEDATEGVLRAEGCLDAEYTEDEAGRASSELGVPVEGGDDEL